MTNKSNLPIHRVEIGNVKAAIWANEGTNGTFLTVTLSRSYKSDDGSFKDTGTLHQRDLIAAAVALEKAHAFIQSQPRRNNGVTNSEDTETEQPYEG